MREFSEKQVHMRRNLVNFLTIIFFIILLIFPANVFAGASKGLLLWFHTVLPTLLPFLITTNVLMHTPALEWISTMTGSILSRIFHVSKHGSFVIITGFLCGYPMGSKITADLLKQGRLSLSEADYLLSFCNNTSPMFIISYVLTQTLENQYPIGPSLLLLMFSPIICSRLFYRIHCKKQKNYFENVSTANNISSANSSANIFDLCIMNGFEAITKIGGYIIIFSILIELIKMFPIHNEFFHYIILPSLEITNGISYIGKSNLASDIKFILCLFHTSFGGFCSISQTQCMIQDCGLKILPYTIEKLVTALVTSLFAICYINFLH